MPGRQSISRPHSHRLRVGRFSEPGRIYLITTATYRRRPLFRDLSLGRIVARALYHETGNAATLAYVVMPDHLHWLMQLEQGPGLAEVVGRIKGVTARRINALRDSRGRIWQPGYHDHAVRREEDIRALARYVVANPLRASLVARLGDYPLWDAVWL